MLCETEACDYIYTCDQFFPFSIEWFELRSEVFLPAACLEVFEVSYVAGKYLVLK